MMDQPSSNKVSLRNLHVCYVYVWATLRVTHTRTPHYTHNHAASGAGAVMTQTVAAVAVIRHYPPPRTSRSGTSGGSTGGSGSGAASTCSHLIINSMLTLTQLLYSRVRI